MLIVALFVGIGVALTLNTMQMDWLQQQVNKQVEITTTHQPTQKASHYEAKA
jgi:hypothetical protein